MVLILRDCDAIPDRIETLRAAFPGDVFHVCPHHMADKVPAAIPIEIPGNWLPPGESDRARAEWWAADALGLAAIDQLGISTDFVWFVESDIWGPVEKWREVFAATAASSDDGIFAKLRAKDHPFAHGMNHWLHAPPWGTHAHLMSLYRLSARAITWTRENIEEYRACFSETRTAATIIREGGTVRDLREFLPYSAPRAFTGNKDTHRFAPGALNHPVKIAIGREVTD